MFPFQVRMDAIDWSMPPQEPWRYTSDDDNDEEREMSSVQKMSHQSNEGTGVACELFSREFTDGHGPLGLNLMKSSSLLELIQRELAQAAKVTGKEDTEYVAYTSDLHTKSTAMQGTKLSDKLKASNFQASLLRVGDWEWKSRYEGDLVAKLYFSKSKVAWEILHEGLKHKIEIKCSDICALKVTCPKGLPGTLNIMVSVEPQFFRETNPRPYRSTRWLATTDFSGGQASTLRHVLQCDPGIMDKHIENLLSSDHRLYLLSQENAINPLEPWFSVPEIPNSLSHQNLYCSDDGYQFGTEQTGHLLPLHPMPIGTMTIELNHYGAALGVLPSSVVDTAVITEEPSWGRDQLRSDMFNWNSFFQMTFMSYGWIMNGTGNHINNQINLGNSHSTVDYSSSRMAMPEVIRRFPDDSTTNWQVQSGNLASHADHGVLFTSSVPVSNSTSTGRKQPSGRRGQLRKNMFNWKSFLRTPVAKQPPVSNAAAITINDTAGNRVSNQMINPWSFKGSQSQTFLQNEPAGNNDPPGNGNDATSSERMALEKIRRSLLGDDDGEVEDAADEERLMSTVNSLSSLLGQDSGPSWSSQANDTLVAPPPGREGQ